MPSEINIADRDIIIEERIKKNKGRQRASDKTPPLTIVSYDWGSLASDKIQAARMPGSFLRSVLFMGMLTNMPGHCLVIDRDGIGHWGCHPESFFVLTEEET
jgi:hypothetical protein